MKQCRDCRHLSDPACRYELVPCCRWEAVRIMPASVWFQWRRGDSSHMQRPLMEARHQPRVGEPCVYYVPEDDWEKFAEGLK